MPHSAKQSKPSTAAAPASLGLFAHSGWDVVPVLAGLAHFSLILALIVSFERLPWWAVILAGLAYAYLIAWNVNGVSHNFIHNPYFRNPALNRAFSLLLSLTLGFSQTMYDWVHMRHHLGNMDRPGPDGATIDPISIYRHGSDGKPENPWAYAFKSFLRDDPPAIYRALKAKSPADARFALVELACLAGFVVGMALFDWRIVVAMAPFYYLGHSLSAMNGYFEHRGANPDLPIAWGVSCYNRFYNATWFNNGYHAEHHFRPRLHWTRMKALHREIAPRQREAGVRVIGFPHYIGFLERR